MVKKEDKKEPEKKEEIDIMSLPEGEISKHKLDATTKQETWISYPNEDGELERFKVIYHSIIWKKKRMLERETWNECQGDKELYKSELRIALMKEKIDYIGDKEANDLFWHDIDPDLAESLLQLMYGDDPLLTSYGDEILKNLQGELLKAVKSGETSEKENKQIKKNLPLDTDQEHSSGKQVTP